MDGLSTCWTHEVNWVHPPIELLPLVAAKLERQPVAGGGVAPFWPKEHWYGVLASLSKSVLIVTHGRRLVCQPTRERFGIDAPGDWPLAFFKLDPDPRGIATRRQPLHTWMSPSQLQTKTST